MLPAQAASQDMLFVKRIIQQQQQLVVGMIINYLISLSSHAWQVGPDFPIATWGRQMVVHGDLLIYLGGWFNKDIFTLEDQEWIKAGEMETERSEFTLVKWNSNTC